MTGKHVEPIKISCGKLRMIMEWIDLLLDELFYNHASNYTGLSEVDVDNGGVSDADLPKFMKALFKAYKECIDLMNYEGS